MKISIIVPCYNEQNTISKVLSQLRALNFEDRNIIVVDDGSKDNSFQKISKEFQDIILIRHKINLGKGVALKTGCLAALKSGADLIVFIDADGQHLPQDIPRLVETLQKDNLDIVFAARQIGKEAPLFRRWGNKFLAKSTSFLSGVFLEDSQMGLKAFWAKNYPQISWKTSGYAVENEIILNVGRHDLKYGQIIVKTIYNDIYKGTTIFDGVKIFLSLLKHKFI